MTWAVAAYFQGSWREVRTVETEEEARALRKPNPTMVIVYPTGDPPPFVHVEKMFGPLRS